MEKLLKLRDEMKEDLLHGSIFPFWEQYTIDHENGGFYGAVTVDKVIHKDASKGLVLNARLLWTFAGAYRIFGDEKYLDSALKSWAYIKAEIINGPAGEWFASGKNSPDEENSHLLCGPWKCPYHNARAAFEIYERCEALEK